MKNLHFTRIFTSLTLQFHALAAKADGIVGQKWISFAYKVVGSNAQLLLWHLHNASFRFLPRCENSRHRCDSKKAINGKKRAKTCAQNCDNQIVMNANEHVIDRPLSGFTCASRLAFEVSDS